MIKDILDKSDLNYDDVLKLLEIENGSEDYYYLIYKANEYARKTFSKGYIFTQIGLNTEPCSGNCKFCSLGRDNFVTEKCWSMTKPELVERLKRVPKFVSDVFLMTTADFDKDQYLDYCRTAREILPKSTRLVANFSDFDDAFGKELKNAGVEACYHIRRLREGIDTDISIETREKTIDSIEKAGIELYYCIEPIGPEHTYAEIANEIIFAKEKQIDVMAVMRRVDVNADFSKEAGEITLLEVTKIVAVSMLAVKPKKSMNVHEPNAMSLIAGVNQLYAEEGGNPRDLVTETSLGRGINAYQARKMLAEANWTV